MSFFDETDEPRSAPRARRPSGTGRRPPTDQQAIMVRRLVAGAAIVVVLILMVVGIHGCQVSATNNALKDYNSSVASLVRQSDATGTQLFKQLTGAASNSDVQTQLDQDASAAQSQLQQARNLNVPSQVQTAQQNFLLTLSLRESGVSDTDKNIQGALSKTNQAAINSIAADMQQFLASDVVYTTQTATQIAAALHAAGISVGTTDGQTIQPTSFFTNLGWLTPTYIAKSIGASSSSSASGAAACPAADQCGHKLNSVSVGGIALSTGGGNTISTSSAPMFTANLTNDGTNTESGVTVQVTVTTSSGTTITAKKVVGTTSPGQIYTPTITLPSTPPTGSASVVVTVEKVPGETNVANNTFTFPVTFD